MAAPNGGVALVPHGLERLGWFSAGLATATAVYLCYLLLFAPSVDVRVAPLARPTAIPIAVEVVGEVVQPGLYELAAGSRVDDALRQAGDLTERADTSLINRATRLTDGQRIVVPSKDALTGADGPESQAPTGRSISSAPRLINLNAASLAELDTLPGVGPVTAQRIADQRQKAPFTSVDELLQLKLVNSSTFDRIRDLVSVT